MEIYTLKNKLDTQNEALNHTQSLLDIQVHESCSKAEELRSLQKKYDVFKERSLTETETNEKVRNRAVTFINIISRDSELQLHYDSIHSSEIRELREKLSKAEDSLKTKQEECLSLRKDMARLTEVMAYFQVTKQENELEQCKNFKAEIRKAEQRIEEMRIERDNVVSALNMIPTCVICLDRRPQVLYMPCSHFVCCESCGNRFENCPTCRQKICGKITVYQ
uniref:RING-type domain-containing protein n=1 Tax=Syphacia muris TaxID=451379 RepID=A0A0N5AXW0_9BILA